MRREAEPPGTCLRHAHGKASGDVRLLEMPVRAGLPEALGIREVVRQDAAGGTCCSEDADFQSGWSPDGCPSGVAHPDRTFRELHQPSCSVVDLNGGKTCIVWTEALGYP